MSTKVLEVNLISAQGLKPSPLQTYAAVFIDPSTKLRTRIDRTGGPNPTWNDKFLFKVTDDFLSSETSGVSFQIFSVGRLRNPLIGTVRFLVSNLVPRRSTTPSFFPLHVQRPSGSFHGVLNIGVSLVEGNPEEVMKGKVAIGYWDLVGETGGKGRNWELKKKEKEKEKVNLGGEFSDSSCSSSSSASTKSSKELNSTLSPPTALKDWNKVRRLSLSRSASDSGGGGGGGGGGILCGLLTMQRRLSLCLSDQNLRAYTDGSCKDK